MAFLPGLLKVSLLGEDEKALQDADLFPIAPTHPLQPRPDAPGGGHGRGMLPDGMRSPWMCKALPGEAGGPKQSLSFLWLPGMLFSAPCPMLLALP